MAALTLVLAAVVIAGVVLFLTQQPRVIANSAPRTPQRALPPCACNLHSYTGYLPGNLPVMIPALGWNFTLDSNGVQRPAAVLGAGATDAVQATYDGSVQVTVLLASFPTTRGAAAYLTRLRTALTRQGCRATETPAAGGTTATTMSCARAGVLLLTGRRLFAGFAAPSPYDTVTFARAFLQAPPASSETASLEGKKTTLLTFPPVR